MPRRKEPRGAAIKFPTPAGAFTRGYRRALADGIDPLEQLDATYECSGCVEITCVCEKAEQAPVRTEAAA